MMPAIQDNTLNDWDYWPPVMLLLQCRFCGFQWSIRGRPNAWVVDCPDCDHMGRVGDIAIEQDCEGDIR